MKTRLVISDQGPWRSEWASDCLVIFDKRLLKTRGFSAWLRKFPASYGVAAGESLKDLKSFPRHLGVISKLAGPMASRRLTMIVVGGGSVGDFGGFVASVFKRGVRLVHIPTTWLAAIDSAHGGKTALNVAGAKNQIGTFYPALETHLVKQFLFGQPEERAVDAMGEALKMMALKGASVFPVAPDAKSLSEVLWAALPRLIRAKLSIVDKDPTESSGYRHLLNLGHTMGHVFEAELRLPHGTSVAYGLIFALIFSRHRRLCPEKELERIFSHPAWRLFLPSPLQLKTLSLPRARVKALLLRDKKRTNQNRLRFVFVRKRGDPVIREISVEEILSEVERQRRLVKLFLRRSSGPRDRHG